MPRAPRSNYLRMGLRPSVRRRTRLGVRAVGTPRARLRPLRYAAACAGLRRGFPLESDEFTGISLRDGVLARGCDQVRRLARTMQFTWRMNGVNGGSEGSDPVATPVDYIASGQNPVPGTQHDEPISSHRVRRESDAINGRSACAAFVGDGRWSRVSGGRLSVIELV